MQKPQFTKTRIKAGNVMVDDHIKVGGEYYRVWTVAPGYTSHDKVAITTYPIDSNGFHSAITFLMPVLAMIDIYNQAPKSKKK